MTKAWPVEGIDPDGGLAENARRILAVRMAEFYSYAPIVPLEDATEELHNLRIAAKRLRYTLELFRGVFGQPGEAQIERVKAIQEELGGLHDHDVRIALIEDELNAVAGEQVRGLGRELAEASEGDHPSIAAAAMRPPPDDPRRGLIGLLGREHLRRRKRYQAFHELWNRFAADGMRKELASLSSSPIAASPNGVEPGLSR